MRTESQPARPLVLFLFAHQDDEYGAFHLIEACQKSGRRPMCAYFTRGADGSGPRRNLESIRVLELLGVAPCDILFPGDELGIDDATLPGALGKAAFWLGQWLASLERVERVYVTAWEGGHHDHDALHALTVHVCQQAAILSLVRQFSLYNRYHCRGPLFRVLSPLATNGPLERVVIPWRRRLSYLRLCLQYPSQLKTWIGLFPFVLLNYLLKGRQTVQPVSVARLDQRPHEGTLYYEYRRFYSWERMQRSLQESLTPPGVQTPSVPDGLR
jgi:LmbE family N-acetylglucosaminyl deacetylase